MPEHRATGAETYKVKGTLERIVYYNDETKYCVGEVKGEKGQGTFTVVGPLPNVQCGETLHMDGDWTHHPTHGKQFKVKSYKSILPATVYGIRKYLGSGLVPGIGKTYANKIVDKFGIDTLKIISEDSGRLQEIPGVGRKRARAIKSSWDEQQAVRNVMMFLQTYGVSVSQCLRIVKTYGEGARQILETAPYKVAKEIKGIGFKTADKIAINIGFSNESPERIDAGLIYALQTLEDEGHTAYPSPDLINHTAELLDVHKDLVIERLEEQLHAKNLRQSGSENLIQIPGTCRAEEHIAYSTNTIKAFRTSVPSIKIEIAIDWAQKRAGFQFAPEQKAAVRASLTNKLSILTGGPGTGKTTILKAIVDILTAKKCRLVLASPTGRAAQRMAETTGAKAQTIHRLLKYDPLEGGFVMDENHPLKCDFVIVDEASMLDTRLASSLMRAIPPAAHLLLVGDINQLPSVGPGNVLNDLIACNQYAVTRLEQIFRQQNQSDIVTTAHAILQGKAATPFGALNSLQEIRTDRDVQFIAATNPETCLEQVCRLCQKFIPRNYGADPIMDIQILAPMHRGVAGITNLNNELQKALNPKSRGVKLGTVIFSVGDKILQTRNNYDKNIFNGDLGKITEVNPDAGTIAANFNDNIIDFERLDMADLRLAYATSIHKSQGSEFPIVIIPLLKQHYMMLQRNLIYTAVTRGKKKVFIVGDPTAYAMAVNNKESTQRITDLQRKIEESQ